jgi:hypothetical protein
MTGGGFLAGAIVGKLLLDKTGWNQSISEVGKDATKLKDSAKQIGDAFQGAGLKMMAAGAAITGAMGLMIAKTTKAGDEFDELRQKTGIATEFLSSLTLAVNKTDLGMGGFATALKFLANNMADAAAKGGAAEEKFKALGVTFKDTAGNLRPLNEVMLDVADRFKAMPDGAEKSALAVDLFGRAGTSMIHMLNLGRDGLQAEMDKAKELGLVFTGVTSAACDKFSEALVDLKGGLQGAGNQIALGLIPSLTTLAEKVTAVIGKVTAWMQAHPGLTQAIGGTVLGIGALFTALGTLSFAIGTVLKQLPTLIAGFKALAAFALNPITIIVTVGVVTALKAISDFKKEFNNMRDAMKEAGSSGFMAFLEGVNSGWRKVALGIKDSNIVMSEANKKMLEAKDTTISVKGALILLGDTFRAIKGAIEAGATTPIANLTALFKEFGLKTRTELTAELTKAEEALKLLRGSVEATPGQIKILEEKITSLKEAMSGTTATTKELTETLTPLARGASFVRDVMQGFSGELTNTFIPAARDMSLVMAAAPDTFDEVGSAASGLELVFKAIGDAIGASAATVKIAMWNMQADVLAAYGIIIAKMPELATTAKAVTTQTKDYFAGLWNDIAIGFGNTIQKWLEGATTFKNFMTGLWDNIKSAFFRMVGEMVAEWLVNFVKNLISGAVSAATSVGASMASIGTTIASLATSVGAVLVTLVTSIGTAIVTLATAISGAMVALATGIASAATIIAAAAPAIIVTALLALGIMSALKLLERIFGSKSGAGDGMGRVVERQDVQISLLTMIKDLTFNNRAILDDIKTTLWSISERFSTALGYLKDIAGATNSLSDSIDDLGHDFLVLGNNIDNGLIFLGNSFDKGLISLGNKIGKGLISVGKILDKGLISLGKIFDKVGKGGEVKGAQQIVRTVDHVPNIIMPLREYRTAAASVGVSGSNSNVNVTFNIRALDGTDMINVVRSKVVPILQNILNHNGLRVPTGAVGGA